MNTVKAAADDLSEQGATLRPMPSQTVGPFFHFGLTDNASIGTLVRPETKGERIRLRFQLLDGDGLPVEDGMIELWQADAAGHYRHALDGRDTDHGFTGFGRLATDASGYCVFETIRPGVVPCANTATQAAHINVSIFARGLLARLCTRVYFEGDPDLAADPVLALIPPERRRTIEARWDSPAAEWRFEVHLQGERETVFFDM